MCCIKRRRFSGSKVITSNIKNKCFHSHHDKALISALEQSTVSASFVVFILLLQHISRHYNVNFQAFSIRTKNVFYAQKTTTLSMLGG